MSLNPRTRFVFPAINLFLLLSVRQIAAQITASPALVLSGSVAKEQKYSLPDLKQLARTTVTAKDHDGSANTYEDVSLNLLLSQAGVPQKSALRGKNMSLAVLG